MSEMVFVFGVIGIVFCLMIGVLVAVGRLVYKDAKALGLNAPLWTILAIFLPNLIGVIIYLVVRSNTPKNMTCSECHTKINESYNVCPECGSRFVAFCEQCKQPVEAGMKRCPYCGEDATDLERPVARKQTVDTHIVKSLGITLAVFFGVMILVLGSIFAMTFWGDNGGFSPELSIMSIENNWPNSYKASFGHKTAKATARFESSEDIEDAIVGEIKVDDGTIFLEVTDENKQVIFSQEFTTAEEPYAVNIPMENMGAKYKAFIKYDGAKGKVVLKTQAE